MKTILQHTCLTKGGEKAVLKNSPFLATDNPSEKKYQFLGDGYYFWDNNIDLARIWGQVHCKNDFYIVEIDYEFTTDSCFDVVGNRSHQLKVLKTLELMKKRGFKKDKWNLSNVIYFLKKLDHKKNGVFNYESIRAVDYISPEKYKEIKMKFIKNKTNRHFSIINPKMIVCVLNKKYLPLHTKRMVS